MGMKPRVRPSIVFSHELWLQDLDGGRTSYWIHFEFVAEDFGTVRVRMDALPGEFPAKSHEYPGVADMGGMVLAMEYAAVRLLTSHAYREGRITWMGLPSLVLAIPPNLASYVHEPYWVELVAPNTPIDRTELCQRLRTYRCGDPAEESEAFLEVLYRKGKARRLFPTAHRARAFLAAVKQLGISGEISCYLPDMPDMPALPYPPYPGGTN